MKIKALLFFVLIFTILSCNQKDENLEFVNTYKITYFGNGNTEGSVPIDNNNYEINDVAKVALNYNNLKREGYSFLGWNTLFDGTGEQYMEEESINIGNSNIELYAQWADNVISHELNTENQLRITGLPEIDENDWYYATVDFLSGRLILNTENSLSNFQFQYKSGGDNFGFLRISQGFYFNTAVAVDNVASMIKILESGSLIDENIFESLSTAEISGYFQNWSDLENVFIPVRLTIDNNTHFGFLKVSFNDIEGLLTIHTIAYNKISNESIVTF
ncbi:InlB B-repeat-containing protein [Sabulilitoribacter arenilitoris]|uniref:InlB B-repeat-containing protein n=1 Tax=Wocania arenilitoris TaxID=2044858 RepID=A0AAE3EMR4_9FLAO|nr:InlB B-repeat-containing protein [Wocania arenilitoris]MCF7568261.1 InlB B-repeat-containing protein [Wocania arenilitoris]